MKGVLLAGGNGKRLGHLTHVTNKHLLHVYDKPMIYYPLFTLMNAGIKEILIISGKEHAGDFLRLLGSGRDFGCHLWYEVQEEAGGIAQALGLAEKFIEGENMAVVLGDNIFENDFSEAIKDFEGQKGAHIFLRHTVDAHRFGVAEIEGDRIIGIEEKPKKPKSPYAVTGFYLYDSEVFQVIKTLKPSARGELEITDVNNHYIQKGTMKFDIVKGEWTDAGTFESLYRANRIARELVLSKTATSAENILEKLRMKN
jgi:glucose-1-phosphate thymidylyltransferase